MTERDWKAGDVAMATAPNGSEFMVVRTGHGDDAYWSAPNDWPTGGRASEEVCVFRKLVMIDLPPGALAGWPVLVDALKKAREVTGYSMVFGGLVEQIEAQTVPPKPDEPQGMGAVVEDASGELYVGLGDYYGGGQLRWKGGRGMTFTSYDRIDAVRVLSDGVSPE